MDNSMALSANDVGMSRKKFLAASGFAVMASGLRADKAVDVAVPAMTGSVTTASEGAYLSKSFIGALDAAGKMVFPHGLGASLPVNILSVNAFIKLPDGKVRNISVEHIDETSISIAAGVPNASIRVGVVYAKEGTSS